MHQIVGNEKQYEEFEQMKEYLHWNMPQRVTDKIREKVVILNENYGSERDVLEDLGGYCIVFPSADSWSEEEYQQIMENCKLQKEQYEYRDVLCRMDGCEWREELFLLGSDFGVIMFYAVAGGEES